MILTSREWATVAWFAIFVVFALSIKSVRSSVPQLLVFLFSPKLLVLFAVIIGYNIAVVWWLWRIGYWDPTMVYDTLLFIAVGGIGSVSKAASRDTTYDGRFFFRTILMNLEVMVVVTFLSDFFPFSFWVEFLLVIPLTALLVALVVVAEHQKGTEQVHQFLRGVQSFIGLLLIIYIVWQVIENYRQLLHIQVLFALELPFVMSAFFVPVLFLVCALFAYEDAFILVSFKSKSNKQLVRWKKWQLFRRFTINLKALQEFRRSMSIHEYSGAKTKDEARVHLKSWSGAPTDQYLTT